MEQISNSENEPKNERKKTFPVAATVIMLAVLVSVAYVFLRPDSSSPSQTDEPIVQIAGPDQGEIKEFVLTAKPFEFSVKEIRVKKGVRVRIVLKNEQGMHDWVVDEFNARTKQIKTGESDTVEFVADKDGTFEYYCSVMTHRQMGMVGKLIVE